MAKFYGKDSAYLGYEEFKYFIFGILLITAPLIGIYLFYRFSTPIITGSAALIEIIIMLVFIEPVLEILKNKSFRFLRGRNGEKQIKKVLLELPESFTVFEDVEIGHKKGNIDFVVVGPTGIFMVEVKSHSGQLGYDGRNLTLNGKNFRENVIRQVHGETWALKNYLRQELKTDLYIYSVLVFSGQYASMDFGYNPIDNIYIVQKDFLLGLFNYFTPFHYRASRNSIESALQKTLP